MKLYYIDGCCENYISDEPVYFRCETCGDSSSVAFEIDTENLEWIKEAKEKGWYIDSEFFKDFLEKLKPFKIPETEIEAMKVKILDYIKKEFLDV